MSEYVMHYQPSPELLIRAMKAWSKPQLGRAAKIRRIALDVVAYIALVGFVVLLLQSDLMSSAGILWLEGKR